jgi:hypothetical protein
MPIRSGQFQRAFVDFSDLFAEAEKKNTSIHEQAVPVILGAVAYCAASPDALPIQATVRNRALSTWGNMLEEKQGQMLLQADIWEWIKEWFPDPVQGERVSKDIKNWMGKKDI